LHLNYFAKLRLGPTYSLSEIFPYTESSTLFIVDVSSILFVALKALVAGSKIKPLISFL